MKSMTHMLLLIFISFACFSQDKFLSADIKHLYSLLPQNCKNSIHVEQHQILCHLQHDIKLKILKQNNTITHIGVSLFDNDEMLYYPKEVYFFIERLLAEYLLCDDFASFVKKYKDNNISFNYNSLDISRSAFNSKNAVFSMLNQKYQMRINKDSLNYIFFLSNHSDIIEISFPANNNVICGMDKSELDLKIEKELKNYTCSDNFQFDITNKQNIEKQNGIFVLKGDIFHKSINSDTYFVRTDTDYVLLHSKKYYLESFANIFLTGNSKLKLSISHNQYGGNMIQYELLLKNFISYHKPFYRIYFGVENEDENNLQASVFFYNPYMNFINILFINTTKEFLFNDEAIIKTKFYSNIPYDNIKNLFGVYLDEY